MINDKCRGRIVGITLKDDEKYFGKIETVTGSTFTMATRENRHGGSVDGPVKIFSNSEVREVRGVPEG